jgi:nicotinamide-nucleotide amidase
LVESQVRERLPNNVYGADNDTIESVVVRMLADRGQSLLTLEQGTGGSLAGRLAAVGGAEQVLHHGLVLPNLGAPVEKAVEVMRQSSDADLVLGLVVAPTDDGAAVQFSQALATPAGTQTHQRSFGGHPRLAADWGASYGLGLLWRYLKETA